jgi:hypothetical protein
LKGNALRWEEKEPDKNYRIQVQAIPADPLAETDWPRQHSWLVDQIEKLYRIFEPRVRALPARDMLLKAADVSPGVEDASQTVK